MGHHHAAGVSIDLLRGSYAVKRRAGKKWEFAKALSRQARSNADSPYAGKCVGVLHQRVVAVADFLEQLDEQLNMIGKESDNAAWVEAGLDYDRVCQIWESH